MSKASRERQRREGDRPKSFGKYSLEENGRAIAHAAKAWFVDLHGREPADVKEWWAAIEAQPGSGGHETAGVVAVLVDKLAKKGMEF